MARSSALAVLATVALLLSPAAASPSCPQLDGIVMSSVQDAMGGDIKILAGLLRIFFHDCFPNGCDGSILLNTTKERETSKGPNLSIQQGAMKLIESIRRKAQGACGPTSVSCADITLLATRDAVVASGGPWFWVPEGNRDSFAPAPEFKVFELPRPDLGSVADLVAKFATRGLGDVADLVALSGAHTVGRAQCGNFEDRRRRSDDDFSKKLQANCTKPHQELQNLDVITPDLFDNGYFKALMFNQGVFTSDMALIKDGTAKALVKKFADSKEDFFTQFGKSMTKLANAPKPDGNKGEIRQFSCFKTNAEGIKTAVDAVEEEEEEEGFAASA